MNFGNILALIMELAIPTVLTVQQVQGEATSGADKKTMATTALAAATQTALALLPAGSQSAAYAQAASSLASAAIDAAVTVTKSSGQYQAATTTDAALPAAA